MSKCFIVLGMHRSATSLVAKAMATQMPMGVELSTQVKSDDNPSGHYEDKRFRYLNADILHAAGGSPLLYPSQNSSHSIAQPDRPLHNHHRQCIFH